MPERKPWTQAKPLRSRGSQANHVATSYFNRIKISLRLSGPGVKGGS